MRYNRSGGGFTANTRWAEINELCLGWLGREVVPEEPLVTDAVLLAEEGVNLRPCGGAGKDDAIVHVHAQGGLQGGAEASEDRAPEGTPETRYHNKLMYQRDKVVSITR